MRDLDLIDEGMVMDIIIESSNDQIKYADKATQSDFDRF